MQDCKKPETGNTSDRYLENKENQRLFKEFEIIPRQLVLFGKYSVSCNF